jgi:hypothetical protein
MGRSAKYQLLACLAIVLGALVEGCGGDDESGGARTINWYVFIDDVVG